MTRMFNDPSQFADEMIEGFAAASSHWVQATSGGVIRSTRAVEPTVTVVIGGGSGHYPAFGGLVGPGIAHEAAIGNLFASPSARQVHSIAKAVDQGKGVLLSYGNYAGDVLHFDEAQARLRAEGHDVRTVVVTDDIWSAPRYRIEQRRVQGRWSRRGGGIRPRRGRARGAAREPPYPLVRRRLLGLHASGRRCAAVRSAGGPDGRRTRHSRGAGHR